MTLPLIWLSKLVMFFSRWLGLGAGSTWPGHIMLTINPQFLSQFRKKFQGKIIVVAGTNGKTTTSKMIKVIAEADGKKVIHNSSGANLLNGIASKIIETANWKNVDLAIFEVDENTLPAAALQLRPELVVLLNLFRDQLDRYGEVDNIAKKWREALNNQKDVQVFLNADDPHIAYIGRGVEKTFYFGIDDKKLFLKTPQHAMDALYCPNCGQKLKFFGVYFSHLGMWECKKCHFTRPKPTPVDVKSPIPGIYNLYNTKAAFLVAQNLGIKQETVKKALSFFSPAFGRQEEFIVDKKRVKIFLSKNPTGFNESIRTVKELGGQYFLLVLNDRIPDGRDVSWIWDVDTEELVREKMNVVVSGDRVYDMSLRIKYSSSSEFPISNFKFQIEPNLKKAIAYGLQQSPEEATLYILPTYSAMLGVRKILTGRKIL